MLDPWARDRSRLKKKLVRYWFENAHLFGASCLRATAEMEAEHFRSFGLRNPIAIVPNGVEVPDILPPKAADGRRRLLFLSRVHPKKGLPLLLHAWARIEPKRPEWELVIAGPDEVGHTAEIKALARNLGLKQVLWRDAVNGAEKSILYRSADAFILPTHAENFGLVIAEALAHEVPVITTRNAPWQGLTEQGCGWWIPLDEAHLFAAMAEATSQPRSALHEMGVRGRKWMQRDFGWDGVAEEMQSVYDWVVGVSPRPECVYD
jgi:glycosyltransferase involved in cell wall biosynthesis